MVQHYEDTYILKWFLSKQFQHQAVLWMSATPKDTKYLKNIFQDKSITLDFSYGSNLILLDLALATM